MIIEFFFDTICPWSYVGKRRLEQVLAERKNHKIIVKWCSLLLNSDFSLLSFNRDGHLTRKVDTENSIRCAYDNIKDIGLSVNIDFNFNAISHNPNTIDAHRLIQFAAGIGKSESALDALFKNYFIEGKNIGEVEVLMLIAKNIGLDTQAFSEHLNSTDGIAEIYASNTRAQSLGITGMPSFVFNGNLIISGAHEPNVLARLLDAASDTTKAN